MEMHNIQKLEQKQTFSQMQIVSLEMLSLNNCELKKMLEEQIQENPLIELQVPEEDGVKISERDIKPYQSGRKIAASGDEQLPELAAPSDETPGRFLWSQIDWRHMDQHQSGLLRYILELVDENGYIRFTPEEISFAAHARVAEVNECLDIVHSLQPTGVGAADLPECLSLQLREEGLSGDDVDTVLQFYLEDVAAGRLRKIASSLNIPQKRVDEINAAILRANPKPLNGQFGKRKESIVPDIILMKEDGEWVLVMNDKWIGTVALSDDYSAASCAAYDAEAKEYITRQRRQANFLNKCIEQRRNTILRCAQYIADFQREYLDGAGPMRPLSLKQVAEAVGIHESTVSRAISDKYIQIPSGVYSMKFFFPFSISEGKASSYAIKVRIKQLISQEDRTNPYNDRELVELLEKEGIQVSRRTIAKYRQQMNLPNEKGRKRQ